MDIEALQKYKRLFEQGMSYQPIESKKNNLSNQYSSINSFQSQASQNQSKDEQNKIFLYVSLYERLKPTMSDQDNLQNQNELDKKQNNSDKKPQTQVKSQYQRKIKLNNDRRLRVCNVLKDLYSNTSGLRNVEDQYKYYVREIENQSALYKNYSLNFQNKAIVRKICNAFLQVRGDGNCFYTAFGFQFLYHLLFSYSDEEFDEFIKKILNQQISFGIKYVRKQIDDKQIEKDCLEEFIYLIEDLRQEGKEIRFEKFRQTFANWQINENGDGFLYCLQTIFFRNLSYQYLEKSEFKDIVLDKENLLIWEEECNTNEVIIKLLAQELKIHTKLLFLDNEVTIREYEEENKNTIILLIKPGHYNIGWNIREQ
ncbi:unnamed protein product (macronuclear) [Paramecium tetraurelia]|uniref:ubiquitinyl hydrolase 1 n=1 Tax=Paramecium tetraurelia TaxID=5888 RepID=A0CMP4_PARTE|nr:uncharacterized protein GSPATT00008540001 [Paramecium tetraurelia]CAK72061.1 unnamed protein product [Paramecium tetraurelia]|eukprot:XP_001439458.1 hypothetical protein (macronuclear) [Paramecium tetraurelia strain d4-2]